MFKEVIVSGERLLPLPKAVLVASRSEPGKWHVVKGQTCTCEGFGYRGMCRHLRAVNVFRLAGEDDAATYTEWLEGRVGGQRAEAV